jgi:hypothetical protein
LVAEGGVGKEKKLGSLEKRAVPIIFPPENLSGQIEVS